MTYEQWYQQLTTECGARGINAPHNILAKGFYIRGLTAIQTANFLKSKQ